ncbi:MAG TPA: PP2C family protein-serine/threonine phosphatase [Candidatus Avamphibacillus sp.]|nr:PP2C family protein-serine/threonine phosphatase [Candidatus Avamphibacillus sp.]
MSALDLEATNYKELLKSFIETQDEQALYGAEKITKLFIQENVLPEEIINLHIQAFSELYPNVSPEVTLSMNFLLETMISFGMALQENQVLREKQFALKSEISVAANMQHTLLSTKKPKVKGLDIGVISVPAHQMNGDYYHFVQGDDDSVGIAIADVKGKGIPAALCMSMIKYSMDSFPEHSMSPSQILKNLNRVVEKNVDASMFITMFYMQYLTEENKLLYASAGHEPGFFYNAKDGQFEEIETKGLVLGVAPEFEYTQYERFLEKGDVVILLTDGVTESKVGERFMEKNEVLDIIEQYIHLPAQEAVEHVYKQFERIQDFQLRDDFTLLFLKKEV